MSKLHRNGYRLLLLVTALCVSLTCGMGAAYAADPVNVETEAKVTIVPKHAGNNLPANIGSTFRIYKVADIADLSPLEFMMPLHSPFDASGIDINAIKTTEDQQAAAQTLQGLIDGTTGFEEVSGGDTVTLNLGVYLVVNTYVGGRYIQAPTFLLFVPRVVDEATGDWVVEFEVNPKIGYDPPGDDGPPPRPTPTEIPLGPPTPTPDDIPLGPVQTGMLQWPIPVFSGLGLLCIGGGAATLRGKKKDDEEEK